MIPVSQGIFIGNISKGKGLRTNVKLQGQGKKCYYHKVYQSSSTPCSKFISKVKVFFKKRLKYKVNITKSKELVLAFRPRKLIINVDKLLAR